ncbi:hypothetical protein A2Y99_03865 [Candidatus Gottesmanbacteria bacterium RBG_13_37_7]|uniref:Glycosyltransferase 2-like domain-containing protein n=1 Tax=Candidatus Gottesmanbacteria bacterium RBG_13_37_7 TaxID=1798369 RepID=A0A1F5YH80_9BACT|nr:MAG: hypothetical protein A2Y99_03865 [Candidatus Gottesmanbacteria bacterium RBG_13_37_7]
MISIILPTYNESGNIIRLINKIKLILKGQEYEIIVVDDASPDGTYQLVKKNFSQKNNVKPYFRITDRGLAKSVLCGMEKSKGDILIVMDTDFNHNPTVLAEMLKYSTQYDLVVGSRYIVNGGMENRIRYLFSYLYNLAIRLTLGLKTHDNLSGFFMMKRSVFDKIQSKTIFYGYGDYFIRLLYYAYQKGLKIKEVPVFYSNRTQGVSKSKFLPMFVDYSKTVLDLLINK